MYNEEEKKHLHKLMDAKIDEYNLLQEDKKRLLIDIDELNINLHQMNSELTLLNKAYKIFNEIINRKNRKYVDAIERIIDQALAYIFDDQLYEFKIEIHGKKCEFYLVDNLKGLTKALNKVGGGIRIVIAIFLQMFFIETRDFRKILFCDESLYDVSQRYREKFYRFLSKYCQKNDFIVVVISHDPSISRFIEHVIDLEKELGLIEDTDVTPVKDDKNYEGYEGFDQEEIA